MTEPTTGQVQSNQSPSTQDLAELESEVRRWRISIAAFASGVLIFYCYIFGFEDWSGISRKTDAWGQLGDYVGGLLNPVVAFAAFYWLTRSVQIQKQELSDTKKSLAESAKAQGDQVLQTIRAAKISAITSLNTMVASEIARIESNLRIASLDNTQTIKVGYFQLRLREQQYLQDRIDLEVRSAVSNREINSLPEIPARVLDLNLMADVNRHGNLVTWALFYQSEKIDGQNSTMECHKVISMVEANLPDEIVKVEIALNKQVFLIASRSDMLGLNKALDVEKKFRDEKIRQREELNEANSPPL